MLRRNGGSLYHSRHPNANAAFAGDPQQFGQPNDPWSESQSGVIVFGGGLPLYNGRENWWRARRGGDTAVPIRCGVENAPTLKLDSVPMGVRPVERQHVWTSEWHQQQRFGHPHAKASIPDEIIKNLNNKEPVGPRH